jgi:hypothetical protein
MILTDFQVGNFLVVLVALGTFASVVSCTTCVVFFRMSSRILDFHMGMDRLINRMRRSVEDITNVQVAQIV